MNKFFKNIKYKHVYIFILIVVAIVSIYLLKEKYLKKSTEKKLNFGSKLIIENGIDKSELLYNNISPIPIFEFINLNNIIDPTNQYIIFNPSIAHWINDLYLVSYRFFKRKTKNEQFLTPFTLPGDYDYHPWGEPKWKNEGGVDNTGFILLKLIKENNIYKPKLVKRYYDVLNINFNVVDTRILKTRIPNQFICYFNIFLSDENEGYFDTNKKQIETCASFCAVMGYCYLEIDPITGTLLRSSKINRLCGNKSDKIEKNWSMFLDDNNYSTNKDFDLNLGIVYGLSNIGIGYERKNNDIIVMNPSCTLYPQSKNILFNFQELENTYKIDNRNAVHISASTPCIKLDNNKWISVGHIKYDYNKILNFKDSSLYNFTVFLNKLNYPKHYSLIYLMFFYIFEKEQNLQNELDSTYKVTQCSPFFLTTPNLYSLAFPSGLEKVFNENKLIISYGDGDSFCKLAIVNIDDIQFIDVNKTNWKNWPVNFTTWNNSYFENFKY
jgi:hypothetical protein